MTDGWICNKGVSFFFTACACVICIVVFLFASALILHSAAGSIYLCVTKRERERLECDSCETLSESLGKSGSSRITVSCVYSCGAHEHTHIGVIKMHT